MEEGPALRTAIFENRAMALGLAVEYLMKKPAFARLAFGHWSRVLTGQIRRGQYFFVLDRNKVVGFAGWASVTEEEADAWASGLPNATEVPGTNGDCAIINAWAADGAEANAMVFDEITKRTGEFRLVFAKREYADGRVRPVKLPTKRL